VTFSPLDPSKSTTPLPILVTPPVTTPKTSIRLPAPLANSVPPELTTLPLTSSVPLFAKTVPELTSSPSISDVPLPVKTITPPAETMPLPPLATVRPTAVPADSTL
jgi:hypothetical protein